MFNNASLKPLRIAAVPDAVLGIVVDNPLVRLEAAIQQATIADTPKEATVQDTPRDTPQEDITLKLAASPASNPPRRNPIYGLVETAMENYSHIDHPDFRPKPRAPQFAPTTEQEEGTNESTDNDSEPVYDNAQSTNDNSISTPKSHQAPPDHAATAAVRDISPIVFQASLGDTKSQ
ncbi:hypothetical protein BGX29_003245, partial [Mortierella sp. GBA35]